jgi:hypothetical protein
LLGLPRRLADTTLRDVVCRLSVDDLRASLHRVIAAAHRRKALTHAELPWHVVALDGKATSLPSWDDAFVQRHTPEQGLPYGLLRTVTCALVSAPGRPCLDAIPIPVHTNEMGHFQFALGQLLATYGELFQVVTYDAGASSEANGRAVVTSGKDYVFRLRNEQRYMHRMAAELCDADDVVGESVDALDNRTTVTRRLTVVAVERHWAYGRSGEKSVAADGSIWEHTRTLLRIESVRCRDDVVVEREVRFWNTSPSQPTFSANLLERRLMSRTSIFTRSDASTSVIGRCSRTTAATRVWSSTRRCAPRSLARKL